MCVRVCVCVMHGEGARGWEMERTGGCGSRLEGRALLASEQRLPERGHTSCVCRAREECRHLQSHPTFYAWQLYKQMAPVTYRSGELNLLLASIPHIIQDIDFCDCRSVATLATPVARARIAGACSGNCFT